MNYCWVDGSFCREIPEDWNRGVLNAGRCQICQKTSLNNDDVVEFFKDLGLEHSMCILDTKTQTHVLNNFPFLEETFSFLEEILEEKIENFQENLGETKTSEEIFQLMRDEESWLEYLLEADDIETIIRRQTGKSDINAYQDLQEYWKIFFDSAPLSRINEFITVFWEE